MISCYTCSRPIEMGAVLGHGRLHCSFECAAETGRRMWRELQVRAAGAANFGRSRSETIPAGLRPSTTEAWPQTGEGF